MEHIISPADRLLDRASYRAPFFVTPYPQPNVVKRRAHSDSGQRGFNGSLAGGLGLCEMKLAKPFCFDGDPRPSCELKIATEPSITTLTQTVRDVFDRAPMAGVTNSILWLPFCGCVIIGASPRFCALPGGRWALALVFRASYHIKGGLCR